MLHQGTVDRLKSQLSGQVIGPDDAGYDQARKVYNAMIDRRPAVIARCANPADVQAAVNFARKVDLPLAVHGGGHSGSGMGTVDGGLVIDLSLMRRTYVDPQECTAQVEGGCTLGDIDRATHPYGLATPTGINSTTGIGGLALGGGMGHLTRRYGLTIDNLLSVDMVLADGRVVTANADQNPDLFWAVRGGGGNFGVVTKFVLKLYPVSSVIAGATAWPVERAAETLRFCRDFISQAPETINGIFAMYTVPPAPPFPEGLHLKKVCGVTWCYTGPEEQADQIFEPVKNFGPPVFYGVRSMPFPVLQTAMDALYPPGLQWYWKADFVNELSDEAIHLHVEHGSRLPTPHSRTQLFSIDGAASRVGKNDTAFSYREARWAHVIVGVDPEPARVELIKSWAVEYWKVMHPYSSGGAYVNFMMHEGEDRVKASYRDNHARLAAIKAKYDPENLFRINQNIRPER